jgi:hypothetical protein
MKFVAARTQIEMSGIHPCSYRLGETWFVKAFMLRRLRNLG